MTGVVESLAACLSIVSESSQRGGAYFFPMCVFPGISWQYFSQQTPITVTMPANSPRLSNHAEVVLK